MISTRDLRLLPDVEGLRRLFQAMAVLDAVLVPEWEDRSYSFDAAWGPGEQLGSMRNGSGDDLYAYFGPPGCWIDGFAHESPMSPYREQPPRLWPGVLDGVPPEFAGCLREPAFSTFETTFCIWRRPEDASWQRGPVAFPPHAPDPDGSAFLLSPFDGRPESYQSHASDVYELDVDLEAVEHVYRHRPLTREAVGQLNPDASWPRLAADVREIGYPALSDPS